MKFFKEISALREKARATAALFMLALAAAAFCASSQNVLAADAAGGGRGAKKPLVVYYTHSGNTQKVAEIIQQKTGADILRIETAKPYPDDYDTLVKQAKQEQADKVRPALAMKMPSLDDYGVIFLGYPNWWSSMPMPVFTFIEEAGLNGRVIAPFDTHGGGGLGHSVQDLQKALPQAKILKPLAVSGARAASSEPQVAAWLEEIGPAIQGAAQK